MYGEITTFHSLKLLVTLKISISLLLYSISNLSIYFRLPNVFDMTQQIHITGFIVVLIVLKQGVHFLTFSNIQQFPHNLSNISASM